MVIHSSSQLLTAVINQNSFKSIALLYYRSINSVDKYKYVKMGMKVGKSVILCQQVVILAIFIPK